jgi:hypothetical protein
MICSNATLEEPIFARILTFKMLWDVRGAILGSVELREFLVNSEQSFKYIGDCLPMM